MNEDIKINLENEESVPAKEHLFGSSENVIDFLISKMEDKEDVDKEIYKNTYLKSIEEIKKNQKGKYYIVSTTHIIREILDLNKYGELNGKKNKVCNKCHKTDKTESYREIAQRIFLLNEEEVNKIISFRNLFTKTAHFGFKTGYKELFISIFASKN